MRKLKQILPVFLAAALQVMPIVRNFFANPAVTANLAIIFRWGIGAAAALESVDAVSGASPSFQLPTNFVATVGNSFSNSMVVNLSGTGNNASTSDGFILTNLLNKADHSVFFSNGKSTTNAIPPGLTCTCISLSGAKAIYGSFTGTPTTPGDYVFSATCLSPGNGSVTTKIFFTITGNLSPPPTITSQPASAAVLAGSKATFSVVAGGTGPFSYQWYFNTNTAIAGATSATLTLSNVQPSDAGFYRVAVSNSGGSTNSADVQLTVLEAPAITAQPANASVVAGANASFLVTATGTAPLHFQWLKNTSALSNGGTISGATSNTLTISSVTANDATNYSVIVTNNYGSVTSSTVSLAVAIPPAISLQPANVSALAGSNVTFTASATGTAPLNFQWRKNNSPLANGGNISGANSGTLSITGISTNDAGIYCVVVTNAVGSATSSNATLAVFAPPAFISQAASRTATVGSSTVFSANVSGTAPLIYRWFKDNSPLADGGNITGANSNVLAIANLTTNDSGNYSLTVTNLYGNASSSNATLTVVSAPVPPTISAQPTNQSVVVGNPVSFSVSVTGTSPLNFQWRKNNLPLANGGTISGANSGTLMISATATNDAANYSVVITNIAGSITSSVATLTILMPPAFISQAASRGVSAGATTVFSNSVSGTAPLVYQWLKNNSPLSDGGNVSGANSNVLTIVNVTTNDAGNYSLFVTNFYGTATSSNAVLTVSEFSGPPVIVMQPQNQSAAIGGSASFSIVATGDGPLSYQWKKGLKNISGATSATLVIGRVKYSDAGAYSVTVANAAGSVTSSKVSLKIVQGPRFILQAASRKAKVGSKTVFQARATGGGPLTYQWFKDGVALTNNNSISGAMSSALTVSVSGTNDAGGYFLRVSNPATSVTSRTATLTVLFPPAIEEQPQDQIVSLGENDSGASAQFSVVATGTGPLHYQWKKNGVNIWGANGPTLAISKIKSSDAGNYFVIVRNSIGSITSANAALKISSKNSDAIANAALQVPVVTEPQPTLQINRDINGAIVLDFVGAPGTNYVLEATCDLSSWNEIGVTNAPADGHCRLCDTNACGYSARFYRLRIP